MRAENRYLSEEQALDLTEHGVSRNEDGAYSWKFDNYVRTGPPVDISPKQLVTLWRSITRPVLLCWGDKSWAQDPTEQVEEFQDGRVAKFRDAGHWLRHDQFEAFMAAVRDFH